MKTLIFNGSPRKNGDTAKLLEKLCATLEGEVRIVRAYDCDISPCVDCRYCWKHSGCAVNDKMQEIYPYFESCDNVVIASPIWFSSLSGPTLDITSRFQTYFAGRFFRKEQQPVEKNGVLIFVGAQPGTEEAPEKSALTIMRTMLVRRPMVATVRCMNTDKIPAAEEQEALAQVREAAEMLNTLFKEKISG